MLSTAHRVLDGDEIADSKGLYKMAHKNHPSTIWVRSSEDNYDWLWQHMCALMKEYTYRYGKIHSTQSKLEEVLSITPKNIPNTILKATPTRPIVNETRVACIVLEKTSLPCLSVPNK